MKHQLTELVRLLEQRGYPFATDPAAMTAQLRHTHDSVADKLHRRAVLIDRNQVLSDRLQQHQQYQKYGFYCALVLWAVVGFASTYGLMQQSAVNFFVLLLGVLGVNTVMLIIWLLNVFLRRETPSLMMIWFNLFQKNHVLDQAICQLSQESSFRKHHIWHKSVLAQQLALSGLLGMFGAALLLLLVRQYRFTWESTLLSHETFTQMMAILAWLPEKLGFEVPNTAAILASRNQLDEVNAAAWGGLLLGSLLCYGVVPRVLAWAISVWQRQQNLPQLDLNLPYYQNITQKWQRRIVDNDTDYTPDVVRVVPSVATQNIQQYWSVALDILPPDEQWYQHQLGHQWLDYGVIASREDWAQLAQRLEGQAVQLMVAVRANQTPDRGTIRRLAGLGVPMVLWLWADENGEDAVSGSLKERLAQWHEIGEQYAWAWLDNVDKMDKIG